MILRISAAEHRGANSLYLAFNDGSYGVVDLRPLLTGPIFEPLRNPVRFAEVTLDPICGTVTWPNGADFAPEALKALLPDQSNARGDQRPVAIRDR